MNLRILILVIFSFLMYGCTKKKSTNDFGNYLKCELPNDMRTVYFEENSNLQDYSNYYVYHLTNLQRDNLVNEIYFKVCDSIKKDCWKKYGNFYSYEISDSTLHSGYYIKAVITDMDINTLIIEEVKWK